jgi:hypothetical protein
MSLGQTRHVANVPSFYNKTLNSTYKNVVLFLFFFHLLIISGVTSPIDINSQSFNLIQKWNNYIIIAF